MITPHDYQREPIDLTRAALKAHGRALVVMATGTGKTVVGAFAIEDLPKQGRGLFLCHNNRILEQDLKQFREILGDQVSFGIFHGEKKHWNEVDILFASFQTFVDWKHAFFENEFDYIIVDESHRGQAPTFKEVIAYFKPKMLLALTATPDRMDQKDIREIFGQEVVNIPLEMAIGRGWVSQVEYHLITDNLNHWKLKKLVSGVLREEKKVSIKQLNETIFIQARDERVAEKILSFGKKKKIVFCESIAHAENFRKFFPDSKVYHSGVSDKVNEQTLDEFRRGECQCILVVDKFNEGMDIPDTEMVVFLRCTDSKTIFLQQLGRGLRKTMYKDKVIVLDFVANAERVMMIREITERVRFFAVNIAELERDPLRVQGKGFDFIFTDEQIDLFAVLERLKKRYVSDVPNLLIEYSPRNLQSANEVLSTTMAKLWWKCAECGYEWVATGDKRTRSGQGCPSCARTVATEKNNLVVTHPSLAKEYSPKNLLPATQVLAGTSKKILWKCSSCDHEWFAAGSSRASTRDKTGCPACDGKVVTEKNNLAVTHPELAREYSPKNTLSARQVIAGSNKKFLWKCSSCDHEWFAAGSSRASKRDKAGCPACAGKVVTEKNNLATTHPELAKEYSSKNPILATQIVAGSGEKVWWNCSKCGHEWQALVARRRYNKTGCPACWQTKRSSGVLKRLHSTSGVKHK